MQHSVCKRVAKSFELQRYIPEYQVYQLCINWESEIPIPPTIFYLSEIFIYPYTTHQLPTLVKKEIPPNHLFIESQTMPEHDTSVTNNHNKSHIASGTAASNQESRTPIIRALDYDKVLASKAMLCEIKLRNQQIVRHREYKVASDGKKKRKA